MENLLESIRAALESDASPETRAAGIAACRTILVALDAAPGQSFAPAVVTPNPTAIAAAVSVLRGVPPDQLLDIAIAKLRAALPAGVEVQPAQPLKFQLIPTTRLATLGGRAR